MTTIIDLNKYRKAQAYQAQRQAKKEHLLQDLGEPRENFFRVSHRTVASKRFVNLSNSAKMLFFVLCMHRNRYQRGKAYFTRSFRQLKKDTSLAISTIQKAQIELHEAGFLIYVSRTGGRTRYQIVDVKAPKSIL